MENTVQSSNSESPNATDESARYKASTIETAYLIPGWMWPVELGWIYEEFRESRSHMEIGTFCGKSLFTTACAMGQTETHPKPVCRGVDPLGYAPVGKEWERSVLGATIDEIQQRARVKVEWWQMSSVAAMREAHHQGLRFDSIFIDGSHHYAETKADIEGWLPFLRPGGIIAGHDYWPADPGVMDAVNEVFPEGIEVALRTRIWWKRLDT